jgi:hypothetical protein
MSQPTPDLQFEHATYEQDKTGVACGMCGKPVGHEYWQWMGRVACASCKEQVARLEAKANAPETFAKAALFGGGTALACGIAYAAFAYSDPSSEWALITIGIGWSVATAIRKATGNVSGRRYQVLAVLLTYLAATADYAPLVAPGGFATWIDQPSSLLVRFALVPVLACAQALSHGKLMSLLSPLVIGIGLWEAWRRTRGLPMVVAGPFRVAPSGQVRAP